MLWKLEELLLSWFKTMHFQCNSCGVICGSGSLKYSSWKICFQNFPEVWKGAAEEVQDVFFWLVDWLIGWLGFGEFFCFSKFYRQISLCMGDVPGSVFLPHLLLWAGPGVSPVKRGLGWLMLFANPGPGELEAAQWASSLSAQLPRAFQILNILSIHWGKEVGGTRGEGDKPCARNPSWWGARWKTKPWRGEKHKVIPVLSFSSSLLVCKRQTFHCLLACSLQHLLLLRNVLAIRNWRDQSSETQKPWRDKTTPQLQTSWEGGVWMNMVSLHLCTGHTRQHTA